jgi:hypothetical protein
MLYCASGNIFMKNIFKNILKGKVVILGIGNTLRRDDGFGPALIERLSAEAGLRESRHGMH